MSFSGHNLLPHLRVLHNQFLGPLREDEERFRSAYFDLELLPYALGACWHALSEFARIQRDALAEFTPDGLKGLAFFGLPSEQRDLLSYMLDNLLDAARRAQNAVIHYLSRGLSMSLPHSMSDLIKQLEKGKIVLPQPPQDEIIKYWDRHGQRLKDYRDLAQHHALVTSDARVIGSADGRVGLYLLLPSNPEAKTAGKLVFGSPNVHAFPYARKQFKILVAFLHWLTKGLINAPPDQRRASLFTVFRDPAILGPGVIYEGHTVPTQDELRNEVQQLLDRLKADG